MKTPVSNSFWDGALAIMVTAATNSCKKKKKHIAQVIEDTASNPFWYGPFAVMVVTATRMLKKKLQALVIEDPASNHFWNGVLARMSWMTSVRIFILEIDLVYMW